MQRSRCCCCLRRLTSRRPKENDTTRAQTQSRERKTRNLGAQRVKFQKCIHRTSLLLCSMGGLTLLSSLKGVSHISFCCPFPASSVDVVTESSESPKIDVETTSGNAASCLRFLARRFASRCLAAADGGVRRNRTVSAPK